MRMSHGDSLVRPDAAAPRMRVAVRLFVGVKG